MTENQLRQKVVKIAVSYLGCKEADGSHRKIIDLYNSHKPLARGYAVKYTDAWCSTFASAVAIAAGLTDIIPTECGCEKHIALFKKLGEKGREIQAELSKYFMVDYDDAGSIGKRYRREDEIGTPYCITVDFQTVGDDKTPADNAVTIRDRDTMEQVRVPISELKSWLEKKLAY